MSSGTAPERALAWGAALLFLIVIDAGITRTDLLWGPTAFENQRREGLVFGQAYSVARKLYRAAPGQGVRTAILGNSRGYLGLREQRFGEALGPGHQVLNLSLFGAGVDVTECVSRHLGRLAPDRVVLAASGEDLFMPPEDDNPALRLLDVGWRDGPLPTSFTRRLDRWLRTLWPLWRFREFSRSALEDRVLDRANPGPVPERVREMREVFDMVDAERAAEIERAWQRWRADPGLDAWVDYLDVGQKLHLASIRARAAWTPSDAEVERSRRVLKRLLTRLAAGRWESVVVLMPENPLLDLDTEGRYHRPDASSRGAEEIRQAAQARFLRVVDARRWMPEQAFLDFDHLVPDLSGFEDRLARELDDALDS